MIKELYKKYIYKDKQGVKSNRKNIIRDYKQITQNDLTVHQLKNYIRRTDVNELWVESRGNLPTRDNENYGIDYTDKEGLYYSQKYIEVDVHQKLSPDEIMLMHGFDPTKFELINAGSTGSKIGTSKNDEEYFVNTYRKLTVRPRTVLFDLEALESSFKLIQPYEVKKAIKRDVDTMLLLTLFDLHFPLNNSSDYQVTQDKIIRKIRSEHRKDIYITIGQDLVHNDNMRGQTSSGTDIEQVDLNYAIDEAIKFYVPIIQCALENSNNTHLIYSKGNHDETVGNMMTRILSARFPQCKVDIKGEHESISVVEQDQYGEYKLLSYGNNEIGLTHGTWVGRKKERLHDVYMALFPNNFLMAKQRCIITGHHHTDRLQDQNGTSVYSLSTRNKTDKWHLLMGFVGSKKRFRIFEFDENEMIGEYIV